ncbi:MgtC/SapB family protein [Geothrix sp. 21YS21S-4]|uniref:MgtC/SapB family protein n=1 Tax=Geothrix sp. 21YS21S-4 TaxID=3068889 RepID=UPI0027B8E4F7|nr:MgtC/SapB family protein [Geothrix sp. 21YS21S-4]
MPGISHLEMILRVAVGAALGGAIGYERDRHGRQAGLRTHLIVALASATFMVVSAHFAFFQNYAGTPGIGVDPSRIAASVVTGIGFLAGGTILKTGLNVQGLTTAAGLWLVAAIGLCAGAGMYPLALAVTLMGLVALTVFRILEGKDDRMMRRDVALLLDEHAQSIQSLLASLHASGVTVSDFDFERQPETFHIRLRFQSSFSISLGTHGFISLLEKEPGVQGLQVRPPA